jgi:hypothetical protein
MRIRWIAAFLLAAALAGPSPAAQAPTDTNTVSQQQGDDQESDLIWNLIGCVGLLGLLGLVRGSDNDGYTDDPI